MNLTEDSGNFVFTEYDQLNFLFQWDVRLNSSKNLTVNSTLVNSFYFYEREQLAMMWILFACIVVGNSSVLVALLLDKSRTSRFNYFIKHLAIADLSVGFISVLTDIVWKITVEWNAGNFACKAIKYSQAVVTYSSTYLLVALTIDRYEAVRYPMNFFKSWQRAKFLVSSAWILSLVFSIPIIVLYEEKTIQGHLQCWIDFIEPWQWQIYMVTISLTVFFIPAFIIAGCYTTIIYTIWSHPKLPDRKPCRKKSGTMREYTHEDFCKRMSSRGIIPKAKVKTFKMTLIIVFVFIFCWSPYIIFDLLQVFGYVKRTQTNIAVATFIQSLAPLNSAANPIIYCLFSTYICRHLSIVQSFQRISKCCCGSSFGKGVKISDKSSTTVSSRVTSGQYINLHHLNRPRRLSKPERKVSKGREFGPHSNLQSHASAKRRTYHPLKLNEALPFQHQSNRFNRVPPPFNNRRGDDHQVQFTMPPTAVTAEEPPPREGSESANPPLPSVLLHNFEGKASRCRAPEIKMTLKAELSQRAKAFSVECLLSAKNGDDGRKPETENQEVGARFRIFGGITAELCCNDLWERFNRLRTEMIVTRAGRRMFPTLKIRLYGLESTATYIVYMDITLAEETKYRYNFQRSEWTAAGPSNGHTSSFYVHPDSPARGDAWMTQQISFDKVKLTNNRKPAMKDQVPVHSMHKYQPRIHVLEIPSHDRRLSAENLRELVRENREKSKTFTFEQTAFISVTAYQNQKITNLKIQSNPFARGFRQPSSSRRGQ